jgi:predicted secreted protein
MRLVVAEAIVSDALADETSERSKLSDRVLKLVDAAVVAAQERVSQSWLKAESDTIQQLRDQLAVERNTGWNEGREHERKCNEAALAAERENAEAWRLTCKGKEEAYVKMEGELAYLKLQRDALLDITWLDLPGEPDESTAKWREQFNKGWVRREERWP